MAVRYAILAILGDGPRHGYGIQQALHERLGLLWPVNHGQVYATLARLTSDGLIGPQRAGPAPDAPTGRAGGRETGSSYRYELRPAGHRLLARWRERPTGRAAARSELVTKVFLAATAGDPARLRRLLDRQSERCTELARSLRAEDARRAAAEPDDAPLRLARRAALALVEADLEWLALVGDELTAGPACRPRP